MPINGYGKEKRDDSWTCYFCYDVFDSVEKYESHKIFHKSDKNMKKRKRENMQSCVKFRCHICGHDFNTKSLFITHLNDINRSKKSSLPKISSSTSDKSIAALLTDSEKAQANPVPVLTKPITEPLSTNVPKLNHNKPQNLQNNNHKGSQTMVYCYDCGRSFTTKRWLQSHLNHTHNAYHLRKLIPPPSIKFSSTELISQEGKKLHNNVRDNSIAELTAKNNQAELQPRKHVPWTKQDSDGRYICGKCPKSYLKLSAYKTHYVRYHNDSVISCKMCTYVSNSEDDILEHKQQRHRYQCDYCETNFSTKHGLMAHVQRDHLKEYVPCKYCGKEFAEAALNIHFRRVHSNQEQKCYICNKIFKNKNRLSEHIERTHSTAAKVCPDCGKCFKRSVFLQHKKIHESKRYKCKVCYRIFARNEGAKTCENRHHNIRKYKCEICPKSYFYQESLTTHMRIHTGEKPYACNQCDRRFHGQQSLYKHSLSHQRRRLI